MAKVHFFCELSKLQTQSVGDEFGPQSSTLYNFTSRHTIQSGSTSRAYTMFSGEVRYQKDISSGATNSLNAILKVDQTKLFNGLPVKYIIYRGINEFSILDSSSPNSAFFINPATQGSKTDDSDHIVKKILNGDSPSNTNKFELGLGIVDTSPQANEIALADTEDLDKLFYNDYTFPAKRVAPGIILGEFYNDFGIDVILEGFWRKPTLDIVRNVDVTSSGSGNQITSPNSKGDKEQILHYMDVAALIGTFYRERIKNESGSDKKDNIYNNILTKFITKNRVYLDIRNDNNLSLNYYDNYNDGIQLTDISVQPAATSNEAYETLGWPIYIFDDLPLTPPHTHHAKKFIETISNERKTKLKLAIANGDNTLNLCFLKHAPTYRDEKFELWNRWPKYEIGEARFVYLKNDGSTYSQNLELSTFQTQNDEVVSFYIRLFYAKQKEVQQTGSGNVKATSDNPLDNLFNLNKLSNIVFLLSRTDSNSNTYYRSIFDGNEKYIHATTNDSSKKHTDILYSGMYKTGVAIDSANIYFFAIPYAFNENIKKPNIKIPIGSFDDSKAFLKLLAAQSNAVADLSIKKVEITQSPANLFLLNLNSTPSKDSKIKSYDSDTFICICMERFEYQSHIDSALDSSIANPFQHNLHPTFLQVIRQDFEPKGTDANDFSISHVYHLIELRVAGYKNNILALDPLVLNFYHKSRSGRLVSSNNAAFQVDLPIYNYEGSLEIGHDPYSSSDELHRYNEIAQSIDLIKKYNPELIIEIEDIIQNGQVDYVPIFKDEVGMPPKVVGFDKELRKYKLSISYGQLDSIGDAAKTSVQAQPIAEQGVGTTQPSSIPIVGKELISTNPVIYAPSGINVNEYENHAVNAQNPKTPEQIAEDYIPNFNVRYPEYNSSAIPKMESYKFIESKGIGLRNNTTPEIVLNEKFRDSNSPIFFESQFPFIENSGSSTLYKLIGLSRRLIKMSEILAHELGHLVYGLKNQYKHIGWELLETYYRQNDNLSPTTSPKYGNAIGHLQGNPSGNRAAIEGYKFSKKFIEGVLWTSALSQIEENGDPVNRNADKFNLKKVQFMPNYLQLDNNQNFEIFDHLWGNLDENEIEIPK